MPAIEDLCEAWQRLKCGLLLRAMRLAGSESDAQCYFENHLARPEVSV